MKNILLFLRIWFKSVFYVIASLVLGFLAVVGIFYLILSIANMLIDYIGINWSIIVGLLICMMGMCAPYAHTEYQNRKGGI